MAATPPNRKSPADLISNLPEHIIHRVLSFLPTKYATRTTAVSKKFRSAWASFPVIEFGTGCATWYINWSSGNMEWYFDFMHDFLQRRDPDVSLRKLTLHGYVLRDVTSEPRIDEVIEYAAKHHVRDLDLKIGKRDSEYNFQSALPVLAYDLPSLASFPVSSVTVLRLEGFSLQNLDLMNFPSIEELKLKGCCGLPSLKVSHARLRRFEVGGCVGLRQIDIEKSDLRSFSVTGAHNNYNAAVKLNSLPTDNKLLDSLTLNKASVDDQWLEETLSENQSLEKLILNGCSPLSNGCVHNPTLKTLVIDKCTRLEYVEIVAPKLETFSFTRGGHRRCEIMVPAASKLLITLELRDASVTDDWVKKCVSELSLLENLHLSGCFMLKRLGFTHNSLKSFRLIGCQNLEEVVIGARNLVSYKYCGGVIGSTLSIDSAELEAELTLEMEPGDDEDDKCYRNLRELLVHFGHCKCLIIDITYTNKKLFIFPEELRNSMLSPLIDLTHLKVKMGFEDREVNWMENLLWLAPHLKTLTIVTRSTEKSIKFEYARKAFVMDNKVLSCCGTRIFKCWRHSLRKVSMENFKSGEEKKLLKFFNEEAMMFEKE